MLLISASSNALQMASVSCNYMQIGLWFMNHRDEDGHVRIHTVLIRLGTVSYTQHMFFIYSSKQQCLVKTRCFGGHEGGHMWMSV